ncbi:MAG: metabolite traffic protein EboE [Pseudomonadota bacterium]
MLMPHRDGSSYHLTYCSNIHKGESLPEVMANLRCHIPEIRAALKHHSAFGIGLRLSAQAASELAEETAMHELSQILQQQQAYIFTINGFPYGPFHGTRVKEDVYLPDWKDPERLRYTNQLADLLVELLPDGQTGSISTVPGAFKSCVNGEQDIQRMTDLLVSHCAHLVRLQRATGKLIVLALEPEPCCFLETIEESVEFFTRHLFSESAALSLGEAVNVDVADAQKLLRRHLTLCLDLCHAAVEFEHADQCFDRLQEAGIEIGKLQISAGLQLQNVTTASAELLKPFFDDVYLHQVVERQGEHINRYVDLPDAFAKLNDDQPPREWRVHFHVPVFLDNLGDFSSTQFFVRDALAHHKNKSLSQHLEVETYTWDVLPENYKKLSLNDAIAQELDWVQGELQ